MLLGDPVGTFVDLQVLAYQFPQAGPSAFDGWDANWLMIAGSVRTIDGRSWTFLDPALTTSDVAELVAWLRLAANGDVAPLSAAEAEPAADDEKFDEQDWLSAAGWLTFTEPNVSFAVGGFDGRQIEIRIGLSHESAPPPICVHRPDRCEVRIEMGWAQVRDAASVLEEELAAHPAR